MRNEPTAQYPGPQSLDSVRLLLPCSAVQSLLPTAVQGRLTDSLREAMGDHLAFCPACHAEYEELRQLQGELAWLMEVLPSAPERVWAKIEAAIEADNCEPTSPYRLLESCLHVLVNLGIPDWSIAPVLQSVALAKEVRQGRLSASVGALLGRLAIEWPKPHGISVT